MAVIAHGFELATAIFPERVLDLFFPLFRPENENWQMRKNTLLLLAKFLKAPDRLSELATIVQFHSFFQK